MTYDIDLAGICSSGEFHQRIRETLPVPEWYGDNLDALHDILTEQGSWTVRFHHVQDLQDGQPWYAAALRCLCRDCGVEITD